MSQKTFRNEIKDRVLVCDGAMGTMIYSRGVYINRCYDELNLSMSTLIENIHTEYISAGAEIIETNTYSANRIKLASFGLDDKVREINRRGAEIARKAAGDDVFVAGSIGPLSKLFQLDVHEPDFRDIFKEQAEGLLEGGVDLFIIETISQFQEMEAAVKAIRSLSDLPIVAQMTFVDEETTLEGFTPADIAYKLNELGVDVGGANCSTGPQDMLSVIKQMAAATHLPLAAQPNAGNPRIISGRYIYLADSEYMAEYTRRFVKAGVRLIGSCCGSTPEHTRAIANALKSLQPSRTSRMITAVAPRRHPDKQPVPVEEKSEFARKLGKEFLFCVEIDPPRGLDISHCLRAARTLKENGINVINIADGPRATARMGPIYLGKVIQDQVGVEIIVHACTRDKNILGLQSSLMGMHALDLHNILVVTGDPPKLGDYPFATAVFDVDSIGLTKMVSRLNRGKDLAGNPIKQQSQFFCGVGVDPGSPQIDNEIKRFHQKITVGAEFAMTQPVYEPEYIDRFFDLIKDIDIPILIGILPLASYKNAEFLHNEVPGMSVPREVRDRLKHAPSKEDALTIGVEVAVEALRHAVTKPQVKGAYIMPPFGKVSLALRIKRIFESESGNDENDETEKEIP